MSNKNTNHKQQKTQNNTNIRSQQNSKSIQTIVEAKSNYMLIPIFIILCIIPLLMRYEQYNPNMSKFTWFTASDLESDVFLIFKLKWFIFMTIVMAIAAVIKIIYKRKSIEFSKIWIPLITYAILAFLSALLSKYYIYSFTGSFEMFESVYAILGYCMVVYYIFLFVEKERDFVNIQYFLVAIAIIIGLLGTFQFLGHDFFATQLGKNMIVPSNLRNYIDLNIVFGAKVVYLSLYNPNYAGVYTALLTPVMVVLFLFQKNLILKVVMGIAAIGLVVSAIGSQSLSGILGLGVSTIAIIIFMWRYLLKKVHIIIAIVVLCVIGIIGIDFSTHHFFSNKLSASLNMHKSVSLLTDMHTDKDAVVLTYNGNVLKIMSKLDEKNVITLEAFDTNNQLVESSFDSATNKYNMTDARFAGIQYGWDQQNPGLFYITVENNSYRFTNFTGDGNCYFVNAFGKTDKMITAPSAIFTGYENFASGRGYIWSRTIPMLKKYIILGSGPDTYTMAFPQQDYMNLQRYGFAGAILTKPHNMYLQMAVQTGLLSLIAFLTFYGIYFVTSLRLYIRGRFTNFYSRMGIAVFIGTISYMFTGLTNDSNICTAPTFWTLLGVGIALNYKAAPLIKQEMIELKKVVEEQQN